MDRKMVAIANIVVKEDKRMKVNYTVKFSEAIEDDTLPDNIDEITSELKKHITKHLIGAGVKLVNDEVDLELEVEEGLNEENKKEEME